VCNRSANKSNRPDYNPLFSSCVTPYTWQYIPRSYFPWRFDSTKQSKLPVSKWEVRVGQQQSSSQPMGTPQMKARFKLVEIQFTPWQCGDLSTYFQRKITLTLCLFSSSSLLPHLGACSRFWSIGLSFPNAHTCTNTKHPCPEWDSNPWSRLPSERRQCTP
jgi:hypothetical protein